MNKIAHFVLNSICMKKSIFIVLEMLEILLVGRKAAGYRSVFIPPKHATGYTDSQTYIYIYIDRPAWLFAVTLIYTFCSRTSIQCRSRGHRVLTISADPFLWTRRLRALWSLTCALWFAPWSRHDAPALCLSSTLLIKFSASLPQQPKYHFSSILGTNIGTTPVGEFVLFIEL